MAPRRHPEGERMPGYLLLMHNDVPQAGGGPPMQAPAQTWGPYLGRLQAEGNFQGGSAIGDGVCARKSGVAPPITTHLTGFIRIEAASLDHARTLLSGNPVWEAGGTVEIRALPRTD
jgi:hypothetical protein